MTTEKNLTKKKNDEWNCCFKRHESRGNEPRAARGSGGGGVWGWGWGALGLGRRWWAGSARASGAPYKGPGQAESWPSTAQSRFRDFF